MLHACVSARDEDLTREVLSYVAENLSPGQAHKVVLILYDSISDSGRLWLSRLV
jgi:hypothetical protein